MPCDDYITQRGATVLLDADDSVIYCHRDQSLLGYSATMERPLAFLSMRFWPRAELNRLASMSGGLAIHRKSRH